MNYLKLSDITNRLVNSFNYETDILLDDIDKNLKLSREMFKNFDERFKRISDDDWKLLLNKAVSRDHDECSICMNKYELPKNINETRKLSKVELDKLNSKPIVLLSCSHIFHSVCLSTFEELNLDKVNVCPECRSAYKKREIGSFYSLVDYLV